MPSIKPAIDEKTTLIASPALVIALKSVYIDFMEIVFDIVFNSGMICFFKTDANIAIQLYTFKGNF